MYRHLVLILAVLGCVSVKSCFGASLTDNVGSGGNQDLCFVWGHRTALVKDRLYIMHGNYTFTTQSIATPQPNLFYLDLSANLTVEEFLSPTTLQRHTIPSNITPNIAVINEDNAAVLWYSNDTLYASNSDRTDANLAAFNTTSENWSFVPVSGSNVHLGDRSSEMSASVPSSGLAFSFGVTGTPGLVKFNGSLPQSLTWSNQTTSGSQGTRAPFVSESEMVYVPMGKEGVLLVMGGMDESHAYDGTPMVPLSQISVYDIESSSWYAVTASGEIPENRGQFCAVVSASPDESSFQITIFGGWDSYVSLDYEDVYVLTVPSFRWIRANVTDDFQKDATTSIGRAHHRCVVYNDAQMIVVGGSIRFGTAAQTNETECNSAYPPIRVLDTSTYGWKRTFDPSTKYSVPPIVTNVIGGDGSGNATLTEPEGGWNFTALQDIFSQKAAKSSNEQGTPLPTTSTTHLPPPSNKPSNNHSGAIAGGVVGGVIGLALIALAGFFFIRRRKWPQKEVERWNRSELSENTVNPNDGTVHEKEADGVAELEPGNRFELGVGSQGVVHEIGAMDRN